MDGPDNKRGGAAKDRWERGSYWTIFSRGKPTGQFLSRECLLHGSIEKNRASEKNKKKDSAANCRHKREEELPGTKGQSVGWGKVKRMVVK